MSDLKQAAARGGVWGLAGQAVQVCAQIGALLVLARWLEPSEFGLAFLVAAVLGVLGVGADLGMGVLVVQRPSVDAGRAAALSLGAGAVLALLCFFCAPAVAGAFGAGEELGSLLQAGSLTLILMGAGSTARARLARALRFRTLASLEAGAALTAAALKILLAYEGFGAWSIVLGEIAGALVHAACCWIFAPRLQGAPGSLLDDGVRIVGARASDAVFQQADRLFIARWLGAAALGLYGFSWQHAMLLVQRLGPVAEQVALPIFSRLQDDEASLQRAYLSFTRVYATLVAGFAAILFAIAPVLVDWLYPTRWEEAVPVMRLLCLTAACMGLNSQPGLLWIARGRMRLRMIWSVVNLAAIVGVLAVGVTHGLKGIAGALAIRALLATAAAQWITRRVAGVEHRAYLRAVMFALALTGGMAVLYAV